MNSFCGICQHGVAEDNGLGFGWVRWGGESVWMNALELILSDVQSLLIEFAFLICMSH